jgi:hypothetical protein
MATFTKFQPFVEAVAEKKHNLGSDQLVVALSAGAPTNTWSQLSEVTQISYTNLSSRNITTSSSAQTSGVYKLTLTDLVLTASGAVATFRYIIIYNDTATNDDLICYFDYGSNVTLAASDTFTIDFSAANGLLQLT